MTDTAQPGLFGDEKPAAMRPGERLVDLTLALHHETDRAWRVSADGDDIRGVWLAKSRCRLVRTGRITRGSDRNGKPLKLETVVVTVSERLAHELRLT